MLFIQQIFYMGTPVFFIRSNIWSQVGSLYGARAEIASGFNLA